MGRIVQITAFLILLALIFFNIQELLRYKWEYDVTPAYESWEAQPENTIDVIFFSSSLIKRGVVPMVLYREAGITSFNWGQAWGTAPVEYYHFLYSLKAKQNPKLVVIDARDMFENRSVENYKDSPYRKFVATMPDKEIRRDMIEEVLRSSPSEKRLEWEIPLFAYHTRWQELESRDSTSEPYDYKEYLKGCQLRGGAERVDARFGYAESREGVSVPDPYSKIFYDAIAKICGEHGIRLAVLTMPERASVLTKEDCAYLKRWCEENGAIYWDYLDPAWEEKLGLSGEFFDDPTHLDPAGAIRFSVHFADVLKETGLLKDHRGEAGYEDWELCLKQFEADWPEA